MKTYKHLYPQIHTFANLERAYRRARKGKRDKDQVLWFEFNNNPDNRNNNLGLRCAE
ncbi:MAG: hypothetical protein L0Y55_12535 [Anaerolineales bacterium]|nr:hypothetical protein [Anaerolineales bacterium]